MAGADLQKCQPLVVDSRSLGVISVLFFVVTVLVALCFTLWGNPIVFLFGKCRIDLHLRRFLDESLPVDVVHLSRGNRIARVSLSSESDLLGITRAPNKVCSAYDFLSSSFLPLVGCVALAR